MTKLGLALFLALGLAPAQAQVNFTLPPPAGVVVGGVMVVTTCGAVNLANGSIAFLAMDHTGALCTNASGGGGGGGLSVVDQTTWAQGVSAFTPTGCVFNDTATLSSGQEGTVRCTTDRQFKVLDSAVLAAMQAPVPACSAVPCATTIGNVGIVSQYPAGAVVYSASTTGTTAATTATLANSATGTTTYLCGFSIRANATAAATVNATVTGVLSGTMNFTQWVAPNASGIGVTEELFSPCYPASATNTPIAVVSGAAGTGGVTSVTVWGYKL